MPRRTELPYLPELLDLLDLARVGGYEGSLDQFKDDLMNRPEIIPFPPSAGPDFKLGGLVKLLDSGIGRLFKARAA
jgi:hypothetical protein|tara:strand:- start:2093 stop:2320 length:228 start_codon:yes stop_codon:yes gene_type:complete